ncbi:alpha/beta fold hydrolase [Microbacterium sp.]|uniref:alpha/beta fold hydrolase n=1 Tax=Microbacterium sp. TaxID=51671 RepID=UPI003A8DF1BE
MSDRERIETSFDVRGARLRGTLEGEGPLVIWGHGLSSDRWAMENDGVMDWAPVVDAGHTLLRLDWRGHGESGGGTDPAEYAWSSLGDDLLALVDDVSPDAPVAAIGCSMGTGAILHAAVAAPERFRALVLTAPPTAWETRPAQVDGYRAIAEVAEQGGRAAVARLFGMQPTPGVLGELDAPPQVSVDDALLPAVLRGAALSDLPAPDAIAALSIPALILSWAGDPGHPVSTGERLHEMIGGSRFAVAATLGDVREWGTSAAAFLSEVAA